MCWLRAACVSTLAILLSACVQKSARASLVEPLRAADSFIATIEAMKHSVAPVVCLGGDGPQATIQDVEGTAFFISEAGEFLTAAHVIDGVQGHAHACTVTAIYLPADRWEPERPEEVFTWYPFVAGDCALHRDLDVAKCKLLVDLSVRRGKQSFEIRPVRFEWTSQPDGTLIAFTGFPLGSRDPLTSRGGVAQYRRRQSGNNLLPGELPQNTIDLIIDQSAWPGASGAPVYLSDGRVIGMLLARGSGEGTGTSVVRPAHVLQRILGPNNPGQGNSSRTNQPNPATSSTPAAGRRQESGILRTISHSSARHNP